jgi:hypothetical protein
MHSMTESRAFLGVQKSACGRIWRDRLDLRGVQTRLRSGSASGFPELLSRVLAGRSVALEEVENFLDPDHPQMMPDPNVLTDMERAASRIADAVQHSESIAIIGDYDVDGATSTALMVRVLRAAGIGPVLPHSGPHVRRLRPECRSDPQHRGAWRGLFSSRSTAARQARRRLVKRASSGSMSSWSIIIRPAKSCPIASAHRKSEPRRRSFRPRPSLRRGTDVHDLCRACA